MPFNSRPHAEVDHISGHYPEQPKAFNSRPHAEVDWYRISMYAPPAAFQLTTSRRGRPEAPRLCLILSIFQLTTSRRGRRGMACTSNVSGRLSTHDLTQRSTRSSQVMLRIYDLSTHDLTQRSTILGFFVGMKSPLSTHDLTQRSTMAAFRKGKMSLSFNSRPHAEVDRYHHG